MGSPENYDDPLDNMIPYFTKSMKLIGVVNRHYRQISEATHARQAHEYLYERF